MQPSPWLDRSRRLRERGGEMVSIARFGGPCVEQAVADGLDLVLVGRGWSTTSGTYAAPNQVHHAGYGSRPAQPPRAARHVVRSSLPLNQMLRPDHSRPRCTSAEAKKAPVLTANPTNRRWRDRMSEAST
jgi:hypothetical protein